MNNIAFIGKARSGKDTAALWLVRNRAYTRLAFADPLKEMALRVDPIIVSVLGEFRRLSWIVEKYGWEQAKELWPEVRRSLQHLGQAIRDQDEEFWVRAMVHKLDNAEAWNMPVVVTDVRYLNEAQILRARGFRLVRIVRPDSHHMTLAEAMAQHRSETELDGFAADIEISNSGTVADLHRNIERAV